MTKAEKAVIREAKHWWLTTTTEELRKWKRLVKAIRELREEERALAKGKKARQKETLKTEQS